MMLHHVTLSESQIRPMAKLHVCFFESIENAATNGIKTVAIYSFRIQIYNQRCQKSFFPGIASKFGLIMLVHKDGI